MPPPTLPLNPTTLPASAPLVVAVSGGPDSVALLAALRDMAHKRGIVLHVAHLDHGLRPEGVDDAAFVARLASDWGLAATVDAVDVRAFAAGSGRGIEDAARHARYAFLAGVARRLAGRYGGARVDVATAHTADDQAETVLMNVIRGAGLDGLAAMEPAARWPIAAAEIASAAAQAHLDAARATHDWPADRPLPRLLRPLLATDRSAVLAFLTAAGIEARTDASNDDRAFLRNRIRLDVVPLLQAINPQLHAALTRLAATAADDLAFIDGAVDTVWQAADSGVDDDGDVTLGMSALRALHPALQRRVLRRAFAQLGGDVRELGLGHVQAILRAVEGVADDGATALALPGRIRLHVDASSVTFRRDRATLPPPRLGPDPIALAVPGETRLPGGWMVAATLVDRHAGDGARFGSGADGPNRDPWRWSIDLDVVRTPLGVRGRVAGDRLPLDGMGTGHKRLQDLFVDAKVPAAERDGWPVVVAGGTILWVPGLRGDARFRAAAGGAGRRVVLVVTPPGRVVGG